MFLKAGSDISYLTLNKRNAFHYALRRGNIDVIKLLLEKLSSKTDISNLEKF